MAKIRANDLKKIKERINKESALKQDGYTVRITVHMGTCGIAAGGEEVYRALNEEMERSNRKDIQVVISGCMGMCSSEPNVTVRRMGEDAILYGGLNAEKMSQIFREHVMNGKTQGDFAVARIK
jgi:NADP-reducing hydrogenase subunit HndB